MRAHEFYEKYGGITIILARFMPIVRTFAPFVAGIGKMSYPRFAVYNVAGGAVWVLAFLLAGWWFGGLEIVQKNFQLVIAAIIVISVLPPIVEAVRIVRPGPAARRCVAVGSSTARGASGCDATLWVRPRPMGRRADSVALRHPCAFSMSSSGTASSRPPRRAESWSPTRTSLEPLPSEIMLRYGSAPTSTARGLPWTVRT